MKRKPLSKIVKLKVERSFFPKGFVLIQSVDKSIYFQTKLTEELDSLLLGKLVTYFIAIMDSKGLITFKEEIRKDMWDGKIQM